MDTKDRLIQWLLSGDTGASSEAIAAKMTGNAPHNQWSSFPRDSGDFGRCYRLLKAVPEFRERINEMANSSKQWAALVAHWSELERLHETKERGCGKRIREIIDSVTDALRRDL